MPDDRREPPSLKHDLPPDTYAPIERGAGGGEGAQHAARRRRRARRRLAALIVLVVLAFAVGLGVGVVRAYLTPGDVGAEVKVTIPEGSSLKEIAAILAQKGVVEHANLFVYQVKDDGFEDDLKPGTYVVHVNEPYDDLVALLLKGVVAPTIAVTLPEGFTIAEQAARIADAVPGFDAGQYERIATDDPPPVKVEGYEPGTMLEGMLFPATYEVREKVKPRAFIARQLEALRANLDKVDMTRARKANLTEYDVLIIASLIEGEGDEDDQGDEAPAGAAAAAGGALRCLPAARAALHRRRGVGRDITRGRGRQIARVVRHRPSRGRALRTPRRSQPARAGSLRGSRPRRGRRQARGRRAASRPWS